MAQGIKLPLEIKNGRLVKLSGDEYIDQLLRIAFIGMESENPFQSLGLGEWMIFGLNDAMTEGEISEKIISIFESFQRSQLARLQNPDEDIVFRRADGELSVEIDYINMETQERSEMEVPIPSGE